MTVHVVEYIKELASVIVLRGWYFDVVWSLVDRDVTEKAFKATLEIIEWKYTCLYFNQSFIKIQIDLIKS